LILLSIQEEITHVTETEKEDNKDLGMMLRQMLQTVIEAFASLTANMQNGTFGPAVTNSSRECRTLE